MGVGIEIVVKTVKDLEKVFRYADKYDINAYVIGCTKASSDGKNRVKIGENVYTKS